MWIVNPEELFVNGVEMKELSAHYSLCKCIFLLFIIYLDKKALNMT
jgi:hypothetical protein